MRSMTTIQVVLTPTLTAILAVGVTDSNAIASQSAESKGVEVVIENWNEGWRTKKPALACQDYSDDADWTNAFGMTERGRDAICRRLIDVFSRSLVMAGESRVVDQAVRFLGPDVAVVVTRIERLGQKTPGGEDVGPRDTRHQRVLHRWEGRWRVVSHLIADMRDPATGRN